LFPNTQNFKHFQTAYFAWLYSDFLYILILYVQFCPHVFSTEFIHLD